MRTERSRQPLPILHAADGPATEGLAEGARAEQRAVDRRTERDRPSEARRVSVDPMRATDRYRLVHPAQPGL